MKKVIAASVMALALTTGASADVKVGLGYTIADTDAINALFGQPVNIRVPIDFDFGLRIEPELGFITGTDDVKGSLIKDEYEYRELAVGGYYNLWKVEKVNMYAGGRLAIGIGENKSTNAAGNTTTEDIDTLSLQALFGAEYFFVENMSFAAQAGLEYRNFEDGGSDITETGTVAHLVIRYFF